MKNKPIIDRRKDKTGHTRFYILPIETEAAFEDLIKFLEQEFGLNFNKSEVGLGCIVRRGKIEGQNFIFVLSDSTGGQFYTENEKDITVAARIAERIEARIRAIMKT